MTETKKYYVPSAKKFRKRIKDADGKYIALYANTMKELNAKVKETERNIEEAEYHSIRPTVEQYAAKWLSLETISTPTRTDYASLIKNYIVDAIGYMYLDDVRLDDTKLIMLKANEKSKSVYKKTRMLTKKIFKSAVKNGFIKSNPADELESGGGNDSDEKNALSDEQADTLLKATKGHRVHTFIALGLYAGLRREEALALKWDSVDLDGETPVINIHRTWHIENNRPIVQDKTKSKAGKRIIPIPDILVEILRESKKEYPSEYVVPNLEGGPLTGTQWTRLWKYVTTRMTIKERYYYVKNKDGTKTKHVVIPELGQKAKHNGTCVYSIDFKVTPHILRHTYATNLIAAGVDLKTVQYLMGHADTKILLKIYAHLKESKPKDMRPKVVNVFDKKP